MSKSEIKAKAPEAKAPEPEDHYMFVAPPPGAPLRVQVTMTEPVGPNGTHVLQHLSPIGPVETAVGVFSVVFDLPPAYVNLNSVLLKTSIVNVDGGSVVLKGFEGGQVQGDPGDQRVTGGQPLKTYKWNAAAKSWDPMPDTGIPVVMHGAEIKWNLISTVMGAAQ